MGILKGLILLAAMMLTAGLGNGYAQNTSANPYLNSWHKYNVLLGNSANSVRWDVDTDNDGDIEISNLTNLQEHDPGDIVWVRRGTEVSNTYAYIEIKFIDELFSEGQNLTLIFSEWDGVSGTGNCVAKRSTNIVVTANTFYLSMENNESRCNNWTGRSWSNADDLSDAVSGNIDFTVNMDKPTNFDLREWSFRGSISIVGFSIVWPDPLPSGNTSHGTWAISNVSGNNFTVTITSTDPSAYAEDAVTFTVGISGAPITDTNVTLTVSSGDALSGTLFDVHTDDNTSLGGDRIYEATLWGIPNTSLVTITP